MDGLCPKPISKTSRPLFVRNLGASLISFLITFILTIPKFKAMNCSFSTISTSIFKTLDVDMYAELSIITSIFPK